MSIEAFHQRNIIRAFLRQVMELIIEADLITLTELQCVHNPAVGGIEPRYGVGVSKKLTGDTCLQ